MKHPTAESAAAAPARRGRRPRNPEGRSDKLFTLHLTASERESIAARARGAGFPTIAAYARAMLLGEPEAA